MADERKDRVELHGGITHLPAEFREVARLANLAGLEGWEFVDADVGLDIPPVVAAIQSGDEIPWASRIEITYRPAKTKAGE